MIDKWSELILGKLRRWGDSLVGMLPNFVLAVFVMIAFVFLAKLVRKLSARIIHRLSKSESVSGLTSAILYVLIIAAGLIISLKILKLEQAVTSLLAGVGIIGLALGFAFQDLTSNFISGAFIVFKRPFDVGHTIDTNGFTGNVEDIQLRSTLIRTLAGLHVVIPNKDIFQKPIINYTLTRARRIELDFFIPDTLDLRLATQELADAVTALHDRNRDQQPEVYLSAIDEGKVKVYISLWTPCTGPDEFLQAKHAVVLAATDIIKKLTIPTP